MENTDDILRKMRSMKSSTLHGKMWVNTIHSFANRLEKAVRDMKYLAVVAEIESSDIYQMTTHPVIERKAKRIYDACLEIKNNEDEKHKESVESYDEGNQSVTACNKVEYKPMTLDEAIAHAEEAVNNTPCGQEHKQLADWLKELRGIKVGNAAKMRKVVEKTENSIDKVISILEKIPETCGFAGLLEDACDVLCYLKEEFVKPALSEPTRNCERYETEAEAYRGWERYYNSLDKKDDFLDYEDWLFDNANGDEE